MKCFAVVDKKTGKVLRTGFCPDTSLHYQSLASHEYVIEMAANALPSECTFDGATIKIIVPRAQTETHGHS